MTTKASGAGRGRVWRSAAGVAVAFTMSLGGAQVVRADEPIVDTAAPPVAPASDVQTAAPPVAVAEASAPAIDAIDEPTMAVGLPPVPPTATIVAVGPPPVPPVRHDAPGPSGRGPGGDVDRDLAPRMSSAIAGALAAAALADWTGA